MSLASEFAKKVAEAQKVLSSPPPPCKLDDQVIAYVGHDGCAVLYVNTLTPPQLRAFNKWWKDTFTDGGVAA